MNDDGKNEKAYPKSNETKIAELTNSYHNKLNEGKQYGIKKGILMGVAHDRDIIAQRDTYITV